jgi:hypothetical protein
VFINLNKRNSNSNEIIRMPIVFAFLGSTIFDAKTITFSNTARIGTGRIEKTDEYSRSGPFKPPVPADRRTCKAEVIDSLISEPKKYTLRIHLIMVVVMNPIKYPERNVNIFL